jgi:dUTPase
LFVSLAVLPGYTVFAGSESVGTLAYPARVAQLIIKQRNFLGTLKFETQLWSEVEEELQSVRGAGGFGSTGL